MSSAVRVIVLNRCTPGAVVGMSLNLFVIQTREVTRLAGLFQALSDSI